MALCRCPVGSCVWRAIHTSWEKTYRLTNSSHQRLLLGAARNGLGCHFWARMSEVNNFMTDELEQFDCDEEHDQANEPIEAIVDFEPMPREKTPQKNAMPGALQIEGCTLSVDGGFLDRVSSKITIDDDTVPSFIKEKLRANAKQAIGYLKNLAHHASLLSEPITQGEILLPPAQRK